MSLEMVIDEVVVESLPAAGFSSVEVLEGKGIDAVSAALLPHLVQLPGGKQALWRCMGLRGTGFPAANILKLAAPECAAAADQIFQAEAKAKRVRSRLIDTLMCDAEVARGSARAGSIERAIRRLQKNKLPHPQDIVSNLVSAVEEYRVATEDLAAARKNYEEGFQRSTVKLSQAIFEVASTGRFQEAIIWQNRQAFHTGIDALTRKSAVGSARDSSQRQREELVASYLQRYTLKNDTIGFFGPIGWAKVTSEGEGISVRPGKSLVAERNVYFEGWCLDVLAEKLNKNKALRPCLAPRRVPFIDVEGTSLHVAFQRPSEITPTQASIIKACDGLRTAKEVAGELMRDASSEIRSEAEFYKGVDELCNLGLMIWAFDLPFEPRPERFFLQLVERIEDERLRGRCLAPFIELDDARRQIAATAGDPMALDRAISNMETIFTRLTGEPATRASGKTYAARTLVYEDCKRDVEINIGPSLLDKLGPAMSLLLTSARWYTHSVAETYRKIAGDLYRKLSQETSSPQVEFASFWQRAQFFDEGPKIVDGVTAELTERWGRVLDIPPGQSRVNYRSEELGSLVRAVFEAPDAGWQYARYHSPDVMIAARSVEAIQRDEYELVIGELHVGSNTLGANLFLEQHPALDEVFEALDLDMPQPRLTTVGPRYWPGISGTTRTLNRLVSPKDFRLIAGSDSSGIEKSRAVSVGELLVVDTPQGLVVRTRDGRLRFDLIEAFGDLLSTIVCSTFKLLPSSPHMPRVYFDRVIVNRESWSIPAGDINFACEKDEAKRFLAAQRWARTHQMPRMVFVKVPVEKKPFFLDFESPTYVSMFAKMVRRTLEGGFTNAHVNLSEMVPDLNQLWLPDAEGQTYTSEFRLVSLNLN